MVIRASQNQRIGILRVARYLRKHPYLLATMLLCGLGAALFEGGTLGVLGLAVSSLTSESQLPLGKILTIIESVIGLNFQHLSKGELFLIFVGVAVATQALKSLLTYLSEVAQVKLAYGGQLYVQGSVVRDVMTRSYSQISSYPAGEIAGIVDQSVALTDLVTFLGKVTRAISMLVIYGLVMIFLSPIMTGLAALVFLLLWWSLKTLMLRLRELSETSAVSEISTWTKTVEFFNAPRLLRVLNTSEEAELIIEGARKKWIQAEQKVAILIAAIIPLFEVVTVAGAGAFLVFAYLLSGESASLIIPKLFVFVLIFFRLKPQVKLLNDVRLQIVKLAPRLEITGAFLDRRKNQYTRAGGLEIGQFQNQIAFKNVCFTYPGGAVPAIIDLNFEVDKGQMVAVVGGSGAGKSTIVNLLLGLYSPTSGKIEIDNQNLEEIDLESWKAHIGVVDQDVVLLNASIADNISFGRKIESRSQIQEAARIACADEFIGRLEDGYDTIVGDRGYKLSGGQKQRLSITRAILHNPNILILDEATSALDSISEKLIQKSLEKMHASRTLLVIAHRLTTIEKADKIIVIEQGRVVEMGSRDDLLQKQGGRFNEYLKGESLIGANEKSL